MLFEMRLVLVHILLPQLVFLFIYMWLSNILICEDFAVAIFIWTLHPKWIQVFPSLDPAKTEEYL